MCACIGSRWQVTITKDLPTLEDAVDFESKPGIDPEEVSGSPRA